MPFVIAMLFFVLNLYVVGSIGDPHTKLGGADNVLKTVFENLSAGDLLEIRQTNTQDKCDEGFQELDVG